MATTLALILVGPAEAAAFEFFTVPSGNVACAYVGAYVDVSGRRNPPHLRCDVRGGLKPKPSRSSRPASCEGDWGDAVALSPTGPTELICHGDTLLFHNPQSKMLR
jgi:uncharacterized protein DUF6636